tara:strand:+ start:3019 stop:4794 length:1776 start_codon:yes stop_codon:yes gene_type:complete
MTVIYKAIPGVETLSFEILDQDYVISANDVKSIEINKVTYGSRLILDEFDSLEEIRIKNTGIVILFNSFPKQTVYVKGNFEELLVKDDDRTLAVHRFGSERTLQFNRIWGAVITSDPLIDCKNMDTLIMKSHEVNEIKLNDELSHILVIGDESLQKLIIKGKRIIRNLSVQNCPKLEYVRINRRVVTCFLNNCPSIDTIIGFGDRLIVRPKKNNFDSLSIGGFWHDVPEWYDLNVSMLQIPHFNAHLTAQEIRSCEDMGGITIFPYSYDGEGGLVQFSQDLGIDIEDLAHGVEIIDLLEIIQNKDKNALRILESWSARQLSWFDQYKVMRVLAALISNGHDSKPIISLRNKLSDMNCQTPTNYISGSVNNRTGGGKWNPLIGNDSDNWGTPSNSVMPFGRIDLEIWLHTELGTDFLGFMKQKTQHTIYGHYINALNNKSKVVKNLLTATLSAANTVGRNSDAERKLSELAEFLYTSPLVNSDPFCCEFTVYHLNVSRVATKQIIRKLIDGIANMKEATWVKASLLMGIVSITNSPRARIALSRLASNKDLSYNESVVMSKISISGKRGFETGIAPTPTWPYRKYWQEQIKK